MLSVEAIALSNSLAKLDVFIVMGNEEKLTLVPPVMVADRFVNACRRFSEPWNNLDHVARVMELVRKSRRNVHIVMEKEKLKKRSQRQSIFLQESRMA